jgi:hypothetical protein
LSFTATGQTLIPTGRARIATITWLTRAETQAANVLEREPLIGDRDLRAWFYRQQALGAHFSLMPLFESHALDVEDPLSVLAAIREAFLDYQLRGDLPELPDDGVPDDAVV